MTTWKILPGKYLIVQTGDGTTYDQSEGKEITLKKPTIVVFVKEYGDGKIVRIMMDSDMILIKPFDILEEIKDNSRENSFEL